MLKRIDNPANGYDEAMNRVRTIKGTIDGWRHAGDSYEVDVNVDGADAPDVLVTVDDGIVTVQAHHEQLEMFRSFSLPKDAVDGWVSARMNGELLTVRVDAKAKGAPRRIAIEERAS